MSLSAIGSSNALLYLPVRPNEVRRLKCVIEIPNNFSTLYNIGDWEPGVHGIGIRFQDSIGTRYSGSLMPLETAGLNLDGLGVAKMLMVKSGYSGFITNAMVRGAVFMRFQTTKSTMNYEEWRRIAKGRRKGGERAGERSEPGEEKGSEEEEEGGKEEEEVKDDVAPQVKSQTSLGFGLGSFLGRKKTKK